MLLITEEHATRMMLLLSAASGTEWPRRLGTDAGSKSRLHWTKRSLGRIKVKGKTGLSLTFAGCDLVFGGSNDATLILGASI